MWLPCGLLIQDIRAFGIAVFVTRLFSLDKYQRCKSDLTEIVTGTTTVTVYTNCRSFTVSHSKPLTITVTRRGRAGQLMSRHAFYSSTNAILTPTGAAGFTTDLSDVYPAKTSAQGIRCGIFVNVLAEFEPPECPANTTYFAISDWPATFAWIGLLKRRATFHC